MTPKPPKRTKQSSITSMGFPLLQKSTEMCVGRQIKVPGSYWKGHMSNEEVNSQYLCTVREYHALHKWDAGGTPSQAMELQEMGVDGQDSRETGGSSSDRIFFMKYPMPFLQHWYFFVSTKKYRIRAWFKYICRNRLVWMPRKCSRSSTSPRKLCTRRTSVRQMTL